MVRREKRMAKIINGMGGENGIRSGSSKLNISPLGPQTINTLNYTTNIAT